jgi:hypothetical protein
MEGAGAMYRSSPSSDRTSSLPDDVDLRNVEGFRAGAGRRVKALTLRLL